MRRSGGILEQCSYAVMRRLIEKRFAAHRSTLSFTCRNADDFLPLQSGNFARPPHVAVTAMAQPMVVSLSPATNTRHWPHAFKTFHQNIAPECSRRPPPHSGIPVQFSLLKDYGSILFINTIYPDTHPRVGS